MLRLLLLLALPASTTACIPSKHPEPGIPATTTTTTPGPACTPFAALPLTTCEAALGYPPNTQNINNNRGCTKAIQTGQSISCGGKKVLFIGSMYAVCESFISPDNLPVPAFYSQLARRGTVIVLLPVSITSNNLPDRGSCAYKDFIDYFQQLCPLAANCLFKEYIR